MTRTELTSLVGARNVEAAIDAVLAGIKAPFVTSCFAAWQAKLEQEVPVTDDMKSAVNAIHTDYLTPCAVVDVVAQTDLNRWMDENLRDMNGTQFEDAGPDDPIDAWAVMLSDEYESWFLVDSFDTKGEANTCARLMRERIADYLNKVITITNTGTGLPHMECRVTRVVCQNGLRVGVIEGDR
jgi:hypothetical protein